MKLSRSLAPLVVAAVLASGLVACSSTPRTTAEKPSAPASATATKKPAVTATGAVPAWANPLTTRGDLLTSAIGTNFGVDSYEVDSAVSSRTGQLVDPDTNNPVVGIGDKIVYVNYVFTNTVTADIPLDYSLATVEPRYANWPYLQGMDSVVDSAQEQAMKVNDSTLGSSQSDKPFVWKRENILLL